MVYNTNYINYLSMILGRIISSLIWFISITLWAQTLPQWQLQQLNQQASFRGAAHYQQDLWLSGSHNSVYLSKDNGKTWLNKSPKLNKQYDFRDIEVLDNQTVIIMSAGSGKDSALFISHNYGETWQPLYTNPDQQGFFDSISFWNKNQGVLLGDPVNGHFVIAITEDQGKSWQRISPQKLPKILADEAAFAASGNTVITRKQGEIFAITGGNAANVYYSADFGQHWRKFSLPLYQQGKTSGGYALALNTQQQVFALGGDYQQRDGQYLNMATMIKNNWQSVTNGNHGLRTAMQCIKQTCVATGKLSTDISFDDGKTWQVLSTDQGFYTLTHNNQVIVGAAGNGTVGRLALSQ